MLTSSANSNKKNSSPDRWFRFWQQWFFWSSIFFALFGVFFALWGDNPWFHFYNKGVARALFQQDRLPPDVDLFRSFIFGPFGGTITAVYVLLAFIAAYPFKRRERWSYFATAAAFGLWAIIDSSFSLYYRVNFEAYLINATSVMVKALPMLALWKYFFRKGKTGLNN